MAGSGNLVKKAQVRRERATWSSDKRGEIRHSLGSSRGRQGDELKMRSLRRAARRSIGVFVGRECVCTVRVIPTAARREREGGRAAVRGVDQNGERADMPADPTS